MEPNIKKYSIPCKDIERYNLVEDTLGDTHLSVKPIYQGNATTQYSFALAPKLYEPSGTVNYSVWHPPYRKKTPAELDEEFKDDIDEPSLHVNINDFF